MACERCSSLLFRTSIVECTNIDRDGCDGIHAGPSGSYSDRLTQNLWKSVADGVGRVTPPGGPRATR